MTKEQAAALRDVLDEVRQSANTTPLVTEGENKLADCVLVLMRVAFALISDAEEQ